LALTTLDADVALIVIDLQKGILAFPTVHPVNEILSRTLSLATAFRAHGLPVVLVNVAGGAPGRTEVKRPASPLPPDYAELADELNAQPSDIRVTKRTWGAFHGTPLHDELQRRGVTQIVLTGVATSIGVETTARSGYEHGYNVVLATDAMSDRHTAFHNHSVERIFPRLGETATTAEILDHLAAR
jgi:nicotinamidase-related amidase